MGILNVTPDSFAETSVNLDPVQAGSAAKCIPCDRIVVDAYIGCAKRAAHSYGVLARLPEIAAALGRPILAGPSRKSFMGEAVRGRPAQQRDWGTAAAVTAAVLGGA